jgi:hypothetical protein
MITGAHLRESYPMVLAGCHRILVEVAPNIWATAMKFFLRRLIHIEQAIVECFAHSLKSNLHN